MRKIWNLGVVFAVGLAAVGGQAQWVNRARLPQWRAGFYWQYRALDPEEGLEYWVLGARPVRGEDHYVLARIERAGEEVTISLAFAPTRAPFPRRTNTPASQTYLDFPLEVGKSWVVRRAASAGFLSAPRIEARVSALEPVETGFGTFDSFRVDYTRGGAAWSVWFAPGVQSWVRQTAPSGQLQWVLAETWRFPADYALERVYDAIGAQLAADPGRLRGLLKDLIRFGFDPERARELLARR